MERRLKKLVSMVLTGVVCAVGLTGCNKSSKQSDYDLLLQENEQLREQLASMDGNTDEAAALRQQYEAVRQRLEAENRELAQALEDMRNSGGGGNLPSIGGAEVSSRGSDVVVTVAGDVLFASGSADLKNDAKATLNNVANAIKSNYAGSTIRVEGYTDTDPIRRSKWGTNEALSAARALAVETYLVSRGLDANQIYSAAFGPAHQRGSKAASRRVEIVVLGGNS